MTSIRSIESLVLDLPPSCVEFWPHDPNYAVVGTYNLQKGDNNEEKIEPSEYKAQARNGSLILLHVHENAITIAQTLSTPFAILDVHFVPVQHGNSTLLGAATSTGSLGLYQLMKPAPSTAAPGSHHSPTLYPQLEHIRTIQYVPQNTLVTAFAWHPTSANVIGATLSSGEVILCSTTRSNVETNIVSLPSHSLEAWALAFQPDGTGAFSGGDDSTLKYCSLRNIPPEQSSATSLEDIFDESSKPQVMWLDRKTHGAGVTAILPLGNGIVVTGSYDDHIRVLHTLPTGRRAILAEMNLGGGVWRLKTLSEPATPFQDSIATSAEVLLLVSCMHAGTRIVKIIKDSDECSIEVLARFEEHQSMNYGSDVQPGRTGDSRTFVSTSFYDRLLCLWRF